MTECITNRDLIKYRTNKNTTCVLPCIIVCLFSSLFLFSDGGEGGALGAIFKFQIERIHLPILSMIPLLLSSTVPAHATFLFLLCATY